MSVARRRLLVGGLAGVASVAGLVVPAAAQDAGPECGRPGQGLTPVAVDLQATGTARTHLPLLSLPARPRLGRSFDLVVRVGEPQHEQRRDHHIAWIEVRYGEQRLFLCELSPDVPFPVVRVPVVLRRADTLTVRLYCTRDGAFEHRLPLEPR